MSNQHIDRIMNSARLRLPGALDDAMRLELFNVAVELLDSDIWQAEIEFVTTPGEMEYDIIPSDAGLVHRLLWTTDNNAIFINASMQTPGTIIVPTSPTTAATHTAVVSMTVTDPVSRTGYPTMPDWIWQRYNLSLLDGLLGKMMSQPAKPYSSERLAIFHMRRFTGAIARARVESRNMNVYGAQRWRFPQAFNTVR